MMTELSVGERRQAREAAGKQLEELVKKADEAQSALCKAAEEAAPMNELVERVRRAIHVATELRSWDEAFAVDRTEATDRALAAIHAILETHAIVPKEPTEEMLNPLVGPNGYCSLPLIAAWRAMLAAAPDPLEWI